MQPFYQQLPNQQPIPQVVTVYPQSTVHPQPTLQYSSVRFPQLQTVAQSIHPSTSPYVPQQTLYVTPQTNVIPGVTQMQQQPRMVYIQTPQNIQTVTSMTPITPQYSTNNVTSMTPITPQYSTNNVTPIQVTQPQSGYISIKSIAPSVPSVPTQMTLPTATNQYSTTQIPTATSPNAIQQILTTQMPTQTFLQSQPPPTQPINVVLKPPTVRLQAPTAQTSFTPTAANIQKPISNTSNSNNSTQNPQQQQQQQQQSNANPPPNPPPNSVIEGNAYSLLFCLK